MSILRVRAWVLGGALLLPLAGGCGASGPVRHEITGKVTYKGEPVEEGIISFEPEDGQASKDGATILHGEYRIPKDKGLFPGRYRVSIVIGDGIPVSGNVAPASPEAPRRPRNAGPPGKERAPPEFNTRSTLVREVTAGGPNSFDFIIP
jgi:hypothetical protein